MVIEDCNVSYISNDTNLLQTSDDKVLYGITLFLFLLALYLLVVLILYVGMNGFEEKKRKRQFTQKVFSRKLTSIEGNLNHSRQFYRTMMFAICILVSLFFVLQLTLQQLQIFRVSVDFQTLRLALKYIYALQIVLGYLFMWVRQRLFYYGSSPLRNLLDKKTPLLALSSLSLIFVMANVVVQMSLAWYWTANTVLQEALTWFCLCVLVQGTLIGLFLYPLWTLDRERKRFLKSTNGNGRVFSSSNVNSLIRRCVIFSSFYFATDLGITLAVMLQDILKLDPFSELVMIFLQNINSIINIACLVCSFRNWGTILLPWKKLTQKNKQKFNMQTANISSNENTV